MNSFNAFVPPDRDSNPVERCCPVCGSSGHQLWCRKDDFTMVQCVRCGMIFVNPVARLFADGRFYDERAEAYYLSPDKLAGDYAPVRFERELRVFRRHCLQGEVLDVGCSTGGFLHQLTMQRPGQYRTLGTDVAGAALDHAESQGVPVQRGWFPEIDFGGRRFDAITFWAVLEHLVDPLGFLRRAAELLKTGGHLFVLVPNMSSLAVRMLGARYRYVCPEHLNYFCASTLRKLVEAAGPLEVIDTRSLHWNPVVLWQDLSRHGRNATDVERAKLLRCTTLWKQQRWLAPARFAYVWAEKLLGAMQLADNLVIVLRKVNERYSPPS